MKVSELFKHVEAIIENTDETLSHYVDSISVDLEGNLVILRIAFTTECVSIGYDTFTELSKLSKTQNISVVLQDSEDEIPWLTIEIYDIDA